MLDEHAIEAANRGEAVLLLAPGNDHHLNARLAQLWEGLAPDVAYLRLDLAAPRRSVRINPLRHYTRATELACRIASISADSDDVFATFATMALSHVIAGMELVGEPVTLMAIDAHLRDGAQLLARRVLEAWHSRGAKAQAESEVDALVRAYRQSPASDPAIDGVLSLCEHDSGHRDQMLAPFNERLGALTAGDMGPLLSPAGSKADPWPIVDLDRLLEQGGVLSVELGQLLDPDHWRGTAVATLVLADLITLLNQRTRAAVSSRSLSVVCAQGLPEQSRLLREGLDRAREAGVQLATAA